MTTEVEILVAGSGIAGLSAALAAARLGRKTLVLTGDTLGGHLLSIEKVDGYPGFADGVAGYDLCPTIQEQAAAAGAEIAMTSMTSLVFDAGVWQVETPTGQYSAKSVILATGTRFKELGVPGESLLRGKGVSQCASCDAPLLREKPAVVAGGGDSALQEALTLAEHCSLVTVAYDGASLTGQAAYRALAEQHPRISLMPTSRVSEVVGEMAVDGAKIEHVDSGDVTELECAGVFVFIGLQPNAGFVDDEDLLDVRGAVETDARMRTRRPGLLAAGTVRALSAGRAAAAGGDGTTAALAAAAYLDGEPWPDKFG